MTDSKGRAGRRVLWRACLADLLFRRGRAAGDTRQHLDAAMDWLARAQDVQPDGGVARQFHLNQGWRASYPETTGYIVETFLDYAASYGGDQHRERALRMADWLLGERLPDGSTYGGDVQAKVKRPAVFNTGMVLFGFVRALELTGSPELQRAVEASARFLVESQDRDGAWRKHLSQFSHGQVHVYNTRTAWALALAGKSQGEQSWVKAAERNIDWALGQRNGQGWFDHNDLSQDDQPLTHTIAYALRGILETGVLTNREEWVDVVRDSATRLLECQRPDGSLLGRYDAGWRPTVSWICLTGLAQTSCIWLRLHERGTTSRFREAALTANRYLQRTQRLSHSNPGIRGGIQGSHPVWGRYIRFALPNWAAKFFADALMLELRTAGSAS